LKRSGQGCRAVSHGLKTYAIALTKIANDVRWLGSVRAPAGKYPELRRIEHHAGKVNPVIPESVLMICAQVIGHDAAITWGRPAISIEHDDADRRL
jgi:fumarate hydratase class II